jgi:hypothetical protein
MPHGSNSLALPWKGFHGGQVLCSICKDGFGNRLPGEMDSSDSFPPEWEPRGPLHILTNALVLSSRLDLPLVLPMGIVREVGSARTRP